MKTSKTLVGFLLFFTSIAFTHCTPDQDYSTTTKDIIPGKWTVDYYYAGQDQTALYAGYEFSFAGNGELTGTNGSNDFTGKWSVIHDVNRNEMIQMNVNSQEPKLVDLSENWIVTDKTISLVALKKDAGIQLRLRKL